MKCSRCGKDAITELRYAGLKFCRDCFIQYFERRVAKTVSENKYLEGAKSIAVAVSGGKDSAAVLYIMNKIAKTKRINLFAIFIDGEAKGYDDLLLKNAKLLCKKLGVKLHIFSLKKEFGFTLDQIAKAKPGQCSCGIFRRNILNKKARELKADRLATGHNIDDEAESILMNLIRGDVSRIARGMNDSFVPRIKPLQRSPENEVHLYAKLVFPGIKFGIECPFRKDVLRYNIKKMIDRLEEDHSGIKFQIFEGNKRIRDAIINPAEVKKAKQKKCKCGELTSGEECQACKLKKEVKEHMKRK